MIAATVWGLAFYWAVDLVFGPGTLCDAPARLNPECSPGYGFFGNLAFFAGFTGPMFAIIYFLFRQAVARSEPKEHIHEFRCLDCYELAPLEIER